MLKRSVRALLTLGVVVILATTAAAQQRPGAASDPQRTFGAYVPIDQLPATEKMPAAPFVIAAYAAVWLLAMLYIGTIWQRVSRLEGEFHALDRRKNPVR